MYLAYRAWALEYPWPSNLVWNNLSLHLDDFQVWLLTERGKEDQSIVFTLFEGFSSGDRPPASSGSTGCCSG